MHGEKIAYLVDGGEGVGEGVVVEPAFVSSAAVASEAAAAAPGGVPAPPTFKFGRLFPKWGEELSFDERMKLAEGLIKLGKCMDNLMGTCHPAPVLNPAFSNIPAGYTYLGQFISHEITFDKSDLLLNAPDPVSDRSPSLDLDSLYGAGPEGGKELYVEAEHPARLKVGKTQAPDDKPRMTFDNDLYRGEGFKALIGDDRNDENLPVAQTHLAFVKFHNRVVDDLEKGSYKNLGPTPPEELFKTARQEVIRHFQWIILRDYLPHIVSKKVLASVIREPKLFKPASAQELYLPLEFVAAAFRFGHSMVRGRYNWNRKHPNAGLIQLFTQTKFSGDLDGLKALNSEWVIDWKRFYDFRGFSARYPYEPLAESPAEPSAELNMAGHFDTVFDLHLDMIREFKHLKPPPAQPAGNHNFNEQRSLTVRNLLRGLALGLRCGEEVAVLMGEKPLTATEVRRNLHVEPFDAAALGGRTPLWFYILKEARERGKKGKLGRVGSRIVAETLVGLIRHNSPSILRQSGGNESLWELADWRPAYGRGSETFEMVDLLRAADVVDPLGKYLDENLPH